MSNPVIKEESPKTPVMTMAPAMPFVVSTTRALLHISRSPSDAEHVKPLLSMPPPNCMAGHMPYARSPYQGSSPRKYKIVGRNNGEASSTKPVMLACLPSRRTCAIATGRINRATSTTTNTTTTKTSTVRESDRTKRLFESKNNLENWGIGNMDAFGLTGNNADGEDSGLPALPSLMDIGSNADIDKYEEDTASPSQFEFKQLQNFVQTLHSEVIQQREIVKGLVTVNQYLFSDVLTLRQRVIAAENINTRFDAIVPDSANQRSIEHRPTAKSRPGPSHRLETDDRSRSPSPSPPEYRQRDQRTKHESKSANAATHSSKTEKARFRKDLQVTIPRKPAGLPAVGLPTPTTANKSQCSTSVHLAVTPQTPFTPGRIGPSNAYKKTTTSIIKRNNHNLDKTIPPANVQFPQLPLTDTELIVYFFNSLSRPIVALRLYARNWGPASIVQVLNDHRKVEPPYLRNTCSVKCTTAIKNGKKKFGDDWEENYRAVFANALDDKATDLIRLAGDELDNAMDYNVLALCANLKKHPEGEDAGVFTRCVQYCQEHNAGYTLSNALQLALNLELGMTPTHPNLPNAVMSPYLAPYFGQLPNHKQEPTTKADDELFEEPIHFEDDGSLSIHHACTNNSLSTFGASLGKGTDQAALKTP